MYYLLFLSIKKNTDIPHLHKKKQNKNKYFTPTNDPATLVFKICCLLRFAFTHCQLLCKKTLDSLCDCYGDGDCDCDSAVTLQSNAAMPTARMSTTTTL